MKYNQGQRAETITTIRSIDVVNRTIDFVVSDMSVDRYDTVVKGWVLDAYVKNPVVLFGHDSRSLPIGRAVAVNQVDGQLVARIQFAPADVYEFADQVFRMVAAGYLNAVSAGFIPGNVEYNAEADSFMLLDNELIEISVVPVPANRNALKKAITDGVVRGFALVGDNDDNDESDLVWEDNLTAEARTALEEWCARAVEADAPAMEQPAAPEERVQDDAAQTAFFAAHLTLRNICRALNVTPPEAPADYEAAAAAVIEARATAAPGAGSSNVTAELATLIAGQGEQLTAIEEALADIAQRMAAAPTGAAAAAPVGATGTQRVLRDIMARAERLAAAG